MLVKDQIRETLKKSLCILCEIIFFFLQWNLIFYFFVSYRICSGIINFKWPKAKSWSKTWIRETLIIYVAKRQIRMALVRAWPKPGSDLLWYQMRRTKFAHTRIIQNIWNIKISIRTIINIYKCIWKVWERNSDKVWLAKSRFRQGLIRRLAKGRDQKNAALIPNETNKVRSHKNNPKYLEYSNKIHMDKYICNKNE